MNHGSGRSEAELAVPSVNSFRRSVYADPQDGRTGNHDNPLDGSRVGGFWPALLPIVTLDGTPDEVVRLSVQVLMAISSRWAMPFLGELRFEVGSEERRRFYRGKDDAIQNQDVRSQLYPVWRMLSMQIPKVFPNMVMQTRRSSLPVELQTGFPTDAKVRLLNVPREICKPTLVKARVAILDDDIHTE
ncbi:hypothetical protein AB5N19_12848 [Seiridium cardinale]